MKKIKNLLICIMTIFLLSNVTLVVFAEGETPEDSSKVWLMATKYNIENEYAKPGETTEITVTYENKSDTKDIKNIKLSVISENEAIKPVGFGTRYVKSIGAGKSYTWSFKIDVSYNAEPTIYSLQLNADYEDKLGTAYSANDTLKVPVRQKVALDFENAELPVKMEQGTTSTIELKLMNTGKTDINNCKINSNIEGISMGGSVFIGDIASGESATAPLNLRVVAEKTGETEGNIVITYEDVYGKTHTAEAPVKSQIIEKQKDENVEEESKADNKKSKTKTIILFIVGLALGGTIGSLIPIAIFKHRQRLEDEKRL